MLAERPCVLSVLPLSLSEASETRQAQNAQQLHGYLQMACSPVAPSRPCLLCASDHTDYNPALLHVRRSVEDLELAARVGFGRQGADRASPPLPYRDVVLPERLRFGYYVSGAFTLLTFLPFASFPRTITLHTNERRRRHRAPAS